MARARNIKPGFFRNAELVELPVEARLLFIGLWTIADRAGRLEDRPKQIKMELFPADSFDCDELLMKLAAIGMVERYEYEGKRYLQVVNFCKHQNPHKDEKASTIPDRNGNCVDINKAQCKHSASTVQNTNNTDASSEVVRLIPDSLLLNPEENIGAAKPRKKPRTSLPADFEPNEASLKVATELGVSADAELPGFIDHHTSAGTVFADWQAGFRKWLRNSVKFSTPKQKQENRHTGSIGGLPRHLMLTDEVPQ